MAGEIYFLSYSRSQFYFAEAINLYLQKKGISTWFDMQSLAPGSDWKASLASAMRDCTAIILVASQAALQSEYVQREVDFFREVGKLIYYG